MIAKGKLFGKAAAFETFKCHLNNSENNVVLYHDCMIMKLKSLHSDQDNFHNDILAQSNHVLVSSAIVSKFPLR